MRESIKAAIEDVKKKYPSMQVSYGSPSREETKARVEARKKEQREAQIKSDAPNIAELERQHGEMKERYKKLGGNKYQYADREQNLSDEEREARGMASSMQALGNRISNVRKAGYKKGGDINLKDCKVSTHGKNSKHKDW